jgi:large repetitive protein
VLSIKYKNAGNVQLKNISLTNDLKTALGSAFVETRGAWAQVNGGNASVVPTFNIDYNGATNTKLMDGTGGTLDLRQDVVVGLTAVINPSAAGAPNPLKVQTSMVANGYRTDGSEVIMNNVTGTAAKLTTDLSDSGNNPLTNNVGANGDTGSSNDPAALKEPRFTTPPSDLVLDACINAADYTAWKANRGGAVLSGGAASYIWTTQEFDFTSGTCPKLRGWKVKFTGTDASGNTVCICANVSVMDNGAPVWDMLPMNKTVNCSDPMANASIQMWLANAGGAWLLDCGTQTGLAITNNYAATAGACGNQTVTFTATDNCGNASSATATLTRTDNTAPVISNVPANVTLTCPATASFAAPTATDACGAATLTFTDVTMGACPAMQMVTRTWVATDACGNTATASSKVTINPVVVIPPTGVLTFNCTANQTATTAAGATTVVVNYTAPTGTSTCTVGTVAATRTSGLASGAAFPVGVSTVVYSATDGCGNTKTCSFTVTVTAGVVTPPTGTLSFNCTTNQTATAASGTTSAVVNYTVPSATSTCTTGSVTTTRVSGLASGAAFPVGVSTVVYGAIDGCGNTQSCTFTVTVTASVVNPPTASVVSFNGCGANQTVNTAPGGTSSVVSFTNPTASSTCATGSVSVAQTSGAASGTAFPVGTSNVVFTATDGCGATKTCSFSVTVNAVVAPPAAVLTLVAPPNQTIACGQGANFGAANASTTCTSSAAATITFVDASAGSACAGMTMTRTYTATDACGNVKTALTVITVAPDVTAPAFTSLPTQDLMVNACTLPVNIGTATATDGCSGVTVTSSFTTNSGATGCNTVNGITYGFDMYVTWKATDACGNVTTANRNVWVIPNGMSFLSVPANKTASCGQSVSFDAAPMVKSTFGTIVSTTFEDVTSLDACGAGTVTRTWTSTDEMGNTALAKQTITLMPDTELPQIFIAEPTISMTCDQMPNMAAPVVGDNCAASDQIVVNYSDVTIGHTITRTWYATDACGNRQEAIQTINMVDTQAPTFEFTPVNKTISCNAPVLFDDLTATDDCNTPVVTFADNTTFSGCQAATTRTWTAIDEFGNVKTAQQTITQVDNIAPVFSFVPAHETLYCGVQASNAVAIAADNCAAAAQVIVNYTDVKIGNVTTRTWAATDACGNRKEAIQTITEVIDAAPAFVTLPTNKTITCDQTVVFDVLSATDDCQTPTVAFVDAIQVGTCETTHTRTWTATDANGHAQTAKQIISVIDNAAPAFTFVPENKTLDCAVNVNFGTPIAIDACASVIITQNDNVTAPTCGNSGKTYTRTWTAYDACGNQSQATQSIVIAEDVTAPVFTQQLTANLEMTAAAYAAWTPANPTSTDNCYDAVTVIATTVQVDACNYDVTYSASDLCGNTTSQVQKIHIVGGACTTGANDLIGGNFQVYPNPASDVLFIESINQGLKIGTKYDVIDNLGRVLISGNLDNNITNVNISTLPASTYTLRIYQAKKSITLLFEKIAK